MHFKPKFNQISIAQLSFNVVQKAFLQLNQQVGFLFSG
jgi:hypothetical protein